MATTCHLRYICACPLDQLDWLTQHSHKWSAYDLFEDAEFSLLPITLAQHVPNPSLSPFIPPLSHVNLCFAVVGSPHLKLQPCRFHAIQSLVHWCHRWIHALKEFVVISGTGADSTIIQIVNVEEEELKIIFQLLLQCLFVACRRFQSCCHWTYRQVLYTTELDLLSLASPKHHEWTRETALRILETNLECRNLCSEPIPDALLSAYGSCMRTLLDHSGTYLSPGVLAGALDVGNLLACSKHPIATLNQLLPSCIERHHIQPLLEAATAQSHDWSIHAAILCFLGNVLYRQCTWMLADTLRQSSLFLRLCKAALSHDQIQVKTMACFVLARMVNQGASTAFIQHMIKRLFLPLEKLFLSNHKKIHKHTSLIHHGVSVVFQAVEVGGSNCLHVILEHHPDLLAWAFTCTIQSHRGKCQCDLFPRKCLLIIDRLLNQYPFASETFPNALKTSVIEALHELESQQEACYQGSIQRAKLLLERHFKHDSLY